MVKEDYKDTKEEREANNRQAEYRIRINSFLMGSLFTVFAIIWSLNPERFSLAIVGQLVLAIVFIFFASLSYAKVGYKEEVSAWKNFAWVLNELGYLLFFNAVGLMIVSSFKSLAFIYFGLVIFLGISYYAINIITQPKTLKEYLFKAVFFIIIILLGGVLPLF